jgi:hypothetical protein
MHAMFRANWYLDLLMWLVAWHTERNNLQIHQLEKLHIKLQRQRLALLQTEEGNLYSTGEWDDDDELEQSILPTLIKLY